MAEGWNVKLVQVECGSGDMSKLARRKERPGSSLELHDSRYPRSRYFQGYSYHVHWSSVRGDYRTATTTGASLARSKSSHGVSVPPTTRRLHRPPFPTAYVSSHCAIQAALSVVGARCGRPNSPSLSLIKDTAARTRRSERKPSTYLVGRLKLYPTSSSCALHLRKNRSWLSR